VAQNEVALQPFAAQVKITIAQARHLIHVIIAVDEKRRGLGRIQDDDLIDQHLDFARGQARFSWPAGRRATTPVTCTTYSLRILSAAANPSACGPNRRRLSLAGAVAHIDEDNAAHIAPPVDPAREVTV
jgi:hypothetical protein